MALSASAALWFLPFVLPICLYVAFTDMREMRITNQAVMALVVIYLVIGFIALPLDTYLWRLVHLGVVLVVGVVLNAAGAVGAGDAKFAAAAAPFVAIGDLMSILLILMTCVFAAVVTHKLAKATALRKLAPDWQSWSTGNKFPMGFALGGALGIYLLLAALAGTAPA